MRITFSYKLTNKRNLLVIAIVFSIIFWAVGKFTTRDVLVVHNPVPFGRNENKITVNFRGRGGNQMFQYASLIGIAKTNNRTPVLLENSELWNMFDLPISTAYMGEDGTYTIIKEEHTAVYSQKFENIRSDKDVYIAKYLQSWKYFENVKKDLLNRHFKIKPEIAQKAVPYIQNILHKVQNPNVEMVGIHVRRGDIVHERRPVGHIPAPLSYFYKAMNHFRKRFGNNVVFVMISNSMMWCKDNLDDSADVFHIETGDPYVDFAILNRMNHMILSVGTFGWWAGYLSKGTVIFYKGYPKANTTMSIEMKQSDFIPRHWVGYY